MAKPTVRTSELRSLYEDDQMSISEIGDLFGVSRQAVHKWLKDAGVTVVRRKRRSKIIGETAELVKHLYVAKGRSLPQIAAEVGHSPSTLVRILENQGVTRWKRGGVRKIPKLERLAVGESITVPKPTRSGKWYSNFYSMAERLGIRLSVQTIDDKRVRLTRVD